VLKSLKKQQVLFCLEPPTILEYIITAGNDDLNTFLEVNQPSNSIAQDKPNYSNIKGGVGIFASSSRSIITHDMWNDFIDKIACHPSTQSLQVL
jgi:hypothetical protein